MVDSAPSPSRDPQLAKPTADILFEDYGLAGGIMGDARLQIMTPHSHAELEMNYLYEGGLTYLFGTQLIDLPARRLVTFWGQVPHAVFSFNPGTAYAWFSVPIGWVFQWGLDPALREGLLGGEFLTETDPDDDTRLENELTMRRWLRGFDAGGLDQAALLLELEARLRRTRFQTGGHPAPRFERASRQFLEEVFRFLSLRYTEPVTLKEIADHVGLHPNYLSRAFKHATGTTLWDYLTKLRVSHAQRLLVTSDSSPVDVALDSGFNSVSHFYAVFHRATGRSPSRYRQEVRVGSPAG